jgi:hypothetical protein
MPPIHNNSEQVALAWLRAQADLANVSMGTTLPQDVSTWSTYGFIQIAVSGRGHSRREIGYRCPVMTAHCWAINPNKQKPPWGKANDLAEIVWDCCEAEGAHNGIENLTTALSGAPKVRVLQVWGVEEPKRHRWGFPTMDTGAVINPGNTAHYTVDFELAWAELPL